MALKKRKKQYSGVILFLLGGLIVLAQVGNVSAASNAPSGPDRYTYTYVDHSIFQWWMMAWEDSELFCKIDVEHEGLPTFWEIYVDCGEDLADAWLTQEACPIEIFTNDVRECPGYYMHLASTVPAQREVALALPPPVVWLTLQDCLVDGITNRCERPPTLVLHGDEPLTEEKIISVTGVVDGESFTCFGSLCELPLEETDEEGIQLSFWAASSYGDTSYAFDAHIRVTLSEDEEGKPFWYVDVLSSQWRGEANASCAESWDAFPPVGGAPEWLSSPEDVRELESDLAYAYLAGNLIEIGVVNADHCPDFGLDFRGQATACGLEAAQPAMLEWQNRFDTLILKAAEETSVPAALLKRLFARESQFWPGTFNEGRDVGLGQLTTEGADFAFLWNPIFFEQFCPLVFDGETCGGGYLHLDADQQERLRGALVYSVNATCETCPLGVDLTQADFSVNVFANTLLASCEQAGRVVYNNTDQAPGETTSYEDLWKFTLLNYNAGAGCLSLAIGETLDQDQELNWENLSQNLTYVCMGTKDYVEDISE
ncbi:MAG: hypothetical protein HN855_05160 [Anaerolineae bacterium]|jgi:hypothetical protein|nr:hypothetical protein [Anaerolineae bacterium]MBT7069608.1 hypothetical protein [Anaerolineae bacterium]MBT7324527.1 hypothetical protein [Anaerolineae bacterium]